MDATPTDPTGTPAPGELPDPGAVFNDLVDAVNRATHFATVVAAIVDTVGPVQVTPARYAAADPARLITVRMHSGPDGASTNQDPMVYGYREQFTETGPITAEQRIADILAANAALPATDQARLVLDALGLPTQVR